MRAIAIIPARMASSRFPGKPLADIAGKSMIERVYRQATLCPGLEAVFVATDSKEIYDHVRSFGGKALFTGECENGTLRVAEALQQVQIPVDVVINVQGDQPLIHPELIQLLLDAFSDTTTQIATLGKHSHDVAALENPNLVKVIFDDHGRAITFTRSGIGIDPGDYYYHIGVYAFRPKALSEIVHLPPTPAEQKEHLEQLRWLEHGYAIQVVPSPYEVQAVDIPDDIPHILKELAENTL